MAGFGGWALPGFPLGCATTGIVSNWLAGVHVHTSIWHIVLLAGSILEAIERRNGRKRGETETGTGRPGNIGCWRFCSRKLRIEEGLRETEGERRGRVHVVGTMPAALDAGAPSHPLLQSGEQPSCHKLDSTNQRRGCGHREARTLYLL